MANKCSACGRYTSATDGAICNKCNNLYHKICVKIPIDAKVSARWHCPACKASTPRKDNSEHPVRGESADYTITREHPQQAESSSDRTDELLSLVKGINEEMKLFRSDMKALRDEMSSLRESVKGFDARIGYVEDRLLDLEGKVTELRARPDPGELLATIERLKEEINDRDQDVLCNDIEITGVPESANENVGHLVSLISGKLGLTYDERDIVFAERAGLRRIPAANSEPLVARPRAIVIRFAQRRLRDSFLEGARVRRTLTSEGLSGAAPPTRLFINERLSKQNKMLFYKAREEGKRMAWRFIWTRGGRIYVRRESGKSSFRVRVEADLLSIFGADTRATRAN